MVEMINDMPAEVWRELDAHFPGVLHPAQPPERGDAASYPQGGEHRMTHSVSRSVLQNRPRYEGVLVHARHLLPVLRFLRDTLGYVMLSSLTAADYPEAIGQLAPHIDVVYHLFRLEGGGYVVLHVHTSRDGAVLPR